MKKVVDKPRIIELSSYAAAAMDYNPTLQGMSHSVEDTVRRFVQGAPLPEVQVLPDEDPEMLNPLRADDIIDIVDAQEAYAQAKEYIRRYEEEVNKMEEENKPKAEEPNPLSTEEHAKVSVDPK